MVQHALYAQQIEQFIEKAGGQQKWNSIKTLIIESENQYYNKYYIGDSVVYKPTYTLNRSQIDSLGHYNSQTEDEFGQTSKIIYDGNSMLEMRPNGYMIEMSDNEIAQYKRRVIYFGEAWLALKAEMVKFISKESGPDSQYEVYEVTYLDLPRKFYIRKDNHLLEKQTIFNGYTETHYDDYRSVNGLLIPFSIKGYINRQLEITKKIKSIEVNYKASAQ